MLRRVESLDPAPSAVALPWLLRRRWHPVGGQALAIAIALALGVKLPTLALVAMVALLALSNVVFGRLVKVASFAARATPGSHLLGAVLLFDTFQLTTQLALSGGTTNPFALLYLVEILIAVLVL